MGRNGLCSALYSSGLKEMKQINVCITLLRKINYRYQMPMFSREYLKQVMKLSGHDVTIFMTFTGRLPLLRDCNEKFDYGTNELGNLLENSTWKTKY
jgi:hypothetical protein